MRKAYILSDNNVIIEVAKTNSDRFMLLMELIHINYIDTHQFFNIEFDLEDTRKEIIELLNERSNKALDIPNYVGRFAEEEIFVNFNFQGKSYKFCTTGFDNKIIFLLNIYVYILENNLDSKLKSKLLIVNNGKEFRDWLEKL